MKLALIVLILGLFPTKSVAAPIAIGEHDGIKIVLFDEPCKLDAVTNLPRRATWTEGGKTFEGCFGVMGGAVVVGYFSDRTVAAIPAQAFVRVSGT